ncbi:NAD(P)-dependent oxidoreductase [Streptomyces hydrogenans]|uniref:NAD(P)-dependent oxidoreductase n=1 Tax=Streptomyces hydrogenans TaxID=1873719 RepID=UPI0037F5E0A0
MAKIALFGATGTIGSRVLREALDRGHQVTAVVRDPQKFTERHTNLTVTTGDVLDQVAVTTVAEGQDVVVSAIGGGDGPGHIATIEPAAKSLIAALRPLNDKAPRLIAVNGAGTLRTPDGKQVRDKEGLPEFVLQIMQAHSDALDFYKSVDDVRWTCLSPAERIEPGTRTGTYRTDLDDLIVNADGTSHISCEDFAVALVDEIEKTHHIGERFTVDS